MADVITVRSLEDVAYLLNILFFNMNNISSIYYDMFINPIPKDVELQRYNEAGELVTVILPNRAKDKITTYTGQGNPNGSQTADVGALYVDLVTSNMYYKSVGSDAFGWTLLLTSDNSNFLTPTGNASQLTNLNMSSASSGTLGVPYGGTGANALSGVIRGNGTSAMTAAVDGIDFLGPESSTGLIMFYPVPTIPVGWVLCDGRELSRTTYARLYRVIGDMYGEGNGSTTFNVPDLMGYFIRSWDDTRTINVPQEAAVGGHTHAFEGSTGAGTAHSHTRGTMEITGQFSGGTVNGMPAPTGAFSSTGTADRGNLGDSVSAYKLKFTGSKGWTGSTSAESTHTHPLVGNVANNAEDVENMVRNMALFPIIKY